MTVDLFALLCVLVIASSAMEGKLEIGILIVVAMELLLARTRSVPWGCVQRSVLGSAVPLA